MLFPFLGLTKKKEKKKKEEEEEESGRSCQVENMRRRPRQKLRQMKKKTMNCMMT